MYILIRTAVLLVLAALCTRHKCKRKPRKAGNLKWLFRVNLTVVQLMPMTCVGGWCGKEKLLDTPMIKLQVTYVWTSPLFGEQYQLFLTTGNVTKRPYPKERAHRILTKPAQLLILHLVLERPGIYLNEIKSEILQTLFIDISLSTICKILSKNGFSCQKLYTTALQQDQFQRQLYILDVSLYSTDMFIFVDETGADKRNALRKFAYSNRGKPLRNHSLLIRGERISAIACMSINGLLDVKTVQGTTDGDDFYNFVHTHLLPHLLPFDGRNHHSIVILDNCSIHHISEITRVINEVDHL